MDRQALSRATDSSDAPPPGYLFNDIAKSASASPAAAQDVATYLVRRLNSKNNPTIKYKCLKVMQMVAENPLTRGGFKRVLVQDSTAVSSIKACLGLRGPPDAVHGDAKFEKVRNQAKETLDAIYSDDPVTTGGGMGSMSGGGYGNPVAGGGMGGIGGGGYGNSGYGSNSLPVPGGGGVGGGMGGSMGGPKKMEGIGNPMFADPRIGQDQGMGISNMSVGEVLKTAKEGFKGMIKDPLARNVPGATMGANGIQPGTMPAYGSSSWNTNAPPGRSELASSTNGKWTMASNRGPNAFGSGGSTEYSRGTGNVSSGVGGSWAAPSSSVSSQARVPYGSSPAMSNANPVVSLAGPTGGAVSDGSYEKNLIQELCPPGGRKAEPPSDKLAAFTQAIPSLNPDLVCPALLDALEDGQPWIIRAKALCVMETTIKVTEQTLSPGGNNNPYSDFFYACKDEIEPLATHTRAAVREPAKRVLVALGLEIPTGEVAKAAPAPEPTQTPAPNLLEFDSEPSGPPQAPPNNPPPTPPRDVPPPAPSVDSGASLFGGMTVKSAVAPAPTAPAPAPVDPDLLGSTISNPPPVTSTAAASPDLFGDAGVEPSPPQKETNSTTQEPASDNTSSGFSFLNSSDAKEETTTETKSEAPKPNFDPLMGLPGASETQTSSSTAQMPQMTPQMAAIYQQQQQQLLMMQAQMQQMQMASGVAGNTGAPFMMPPQQNSNPNFNMPVNVMGATGGSGAKTSFAFMEDPNKKRKEASNKKFDFVQDAMKGAK